MNIIKWILSNEYYQVSGNYKKPYKVPENIKKHQEVFRSQEMSKGLYVKKYYQVSSSIINVGEFPSLPRILSSINEWH